MRQAKTAAPARQRAKTATPLNQPLEADPKLSEAHLLLSWMHLSLRHPEAALDDANRAVAPGESTDNLIARATILLELGRPKRPAPTWRRRGPKARQPSDERSPPPRSGPPGTTPP